MYRIFFFIGLCISIIVYGYASNKNNEGFLISSFLFLILFACCFIFNMIMGVI